MVIVMMSMALTMMFGQAVGGVLLAGLIFGHFGFSMYAGMQIFGFALFIFCIGCQAGSTQCAGLQINRGKLRITYKSSSSFNGLRMPAILQALLGEFEVD